MTFFTDHLSFDLIWVFAWGVGLGFVHWALFWVLDILPLGDDRRASLARLRPLVGIAFALIFGLFSAHALFSRYPAMLPIALLLVLVAFFVGSRNLVRDFFAGVALRAERSFQIGDHIRIGETRGRVTDLGPRAIALATPEGDSALVPYSQAATLPILRTRSVDRSASRTFKLKSPGAVPFATACRQIERAALLHHWGSVARPPEVSPAADGGLEVTIFALAQEHTDDVEKAVRKAVERATSP